MNKGRDFCYKSLITNTTSPVVEISQLLVNWSKGDEAALEELMPFVYAELRKMARTYLRQRVGPPSLQPTVLVHEAYLRLVRQEQVRCMHRPQFFALASKLMRSILVDHVRRRRAAKRGGGDYAVTLSWVQRERGDDFDLITLDEALNELAVERPRHSRIVELRFFGGLTIEETAQALGVSHATVEREWRLARAWLHRQVSQETARRRVR